METFIKILIYVHALFGGIGLIAGLITIFVKKGGFHHKKSGKIFSFAMLISASIALVIAILPAHKNLFLFLIGIFTIYLVMSGNRALTLKSTTKLRADWIDLSISGIMFLASIIMITIGIIGLIQNINHVELFVFFGSFGAFLTIKDFQTFKIFKEKKNAWLLNHLGRMIGALIASITAFLVVGLNIGTVLIWILPTIIGTFYIIFWNRKINKK